jgi:hypothetical protein
VAQMLDCMRRRGAGKPEILKAQEKARSTNG